MFRTIIGGGALLGAPMAGATPLPPPPGASRWTLWYRYPAERWVEALPVGNGRLGAMVFGGGPRERLQLNEDSFWGGGPYDPSDPGALDALPEVRRLIFAGRYAEAQELANTRLMARPRRQMSYATLGELVIEMPGEDDADEYRRWLDLDAAEAVTEWQVGERRFTRTIFASAADQVLVVRIEGDGAPFSAELGFSLEGARADGDGLLLEGRNREQHGIEGALGFAAGLKALTGGGRVETANGRLRLRDVRSAELLIALRTSYRTWQDVSADPVALVRADLAAAMRHSPAERLARHRAEHRRLFGGFDIDLGADPNPQAPTDRRVRFSHETGGDDPFLAALYVQYARYLLISCSRPGGQPANLQGLWNESNSPPWGSKYTININTEMNYWPAEPLGLAECTEPLIRMVEDLAESGRRTAQVNYGARGWVCHHNTDLWRASAPIDGAFFGLWPTGGAWLCKHLWDRWDYGRDPAVLRRIYPVLRGAGEFFLDTLVEHPGGFGLVTCPSISPENGHRPQVSICAGPAMDRQIIRELFENIAQASELLDVDAELRSRFRDAAVRLPADRIGKAGQLQEWLEDWDMEANDLQHRHVSHLYALYPGHAIGPETPALHAAAQRSLQIRGDDATGWGIGWRINLWARLGNGARAYNVLRKLLGPDRTYPNLMDAHPPFQIDGNFGGAAGIVEMLLRDRPQLLELLPALSPLWRTGRIDGVRLRGGLTASLRWEEGTLAELRLRASEPCRREIAYRDVRTVVEVPHGGERVLRLRNGALN